MQANAAGAVEETCISLPFGDSLNCLQALGGDASTRHFIGKERDVESGLDYFGARYYGSLDERFQSPDWSAKPEAVPYSDLMDPQSLNLYGYVRNNPMSKEDADGHDEEVDCCTVEDITEVVKPLVDSAEGVLETGAERSISLVGNSIGAAAFFLMNPTPLHDPAEDAMIRSQRQPVAPLPPPVITMAEDHKKNARPSTKDKHGRRRPGTSPPPNFKPSRKYVQPKVDKKKDKPKPPYPRKNRDKNAGTGFDE